MTGAWTGAYHGVIWLIALVTVIVVGGAVVAWLEARERRRNAEARRIVARHRRDSEKAAER